jgi:hypothetical protein
LSSGYRDYFHGNKPGRTWRWPLIFIEGRGWEFLQFYLHFPLSLHVILLPFIICIIIIIRLSHLIVDQFPLSK